MAIRTAGSRVGSDGSRSRWRSAARILPLLGVPILAFAVAFALDLSTNRQYSQIWGSGALLASASIVPAVRRTFVPVGAYVGIWVGFNALRAVADDSGLTLLPRDGVATIETWLFRGTLPSEYAQRAVVDPGSPGALELAATAVYLSFFVLPHVVAVSLLILDRRRFWRLARALIVLFGAAVLVFALVPTEPPWMVAALSADIGPVDRLPRMALAELGIGSRPMAATHRGYAFEPNPLATIPSIHLGVTAVLAAAAWRSCPPLRWGARLYAAAMAVALVVSGEHYVVDVVSGAVLAAVAWAVTARAWKRQIGPSPATRPGGRAHGQSTPHGASARRL